MSRTHSEGLEPGAWKIIAVAMLGPFMSQMDSTTDGVVLTEDVAIAIAVAIWGPIYGADQIAHERPYHAKLINGVWWVSGSLPPGWVGGVAEARIQKANGRVLGVIHGQ